MRKYKVLFESFDKNQFLFETSASSKEDAINKGFDKIQEIQYDIYGYRVIQVYKG